jgi:hypothetical protein
MNSAALTAAMVAGFRQRDLAVSDAVFFCLACNFMIFLTTVRGTCLK